MKRKIVMVIMMFALTVLCLPVTMEAKTDKKKPTVKLAKTVSTWTNRSVPIKVSAKDKSGIKSIVWKKGKIKKSGKKYWKGAKNIKSKKRFNASVNGWYTVKVTDKKGNSKMARIQINNIDKVGPTIALDYSVNNKVATVSVGAADARGVGAVRWAQGYITSKNISQFPNVVTNGTFTGIQKGYYTVYAQDTLGNVSLQTIYVQLWTDLYSCTVFDKESGGPVDSAVYDRWGNMYPNVVGIGPCKYGDYFVEYHLNGGYRRISGTIVRGKGFDDEEDVWLEIIADGVVVYTSKVLNYKTEPLSFDIAINNARYLKIKAYSKRLSYSYSWNSSSCMGLYIANGQLYN